jgi:hypothetical protein
LTVLGWFFPILFCFISKVITPTSRCDEKLCEPDANKFCVL